MHLKPPDSVHPLRQVLSGVSPPSLLCALGARRGAVGAVGDVQAVAATMAATAATRRRAARRDIEGGSGRRAW